MCCASVTNVPSLLVATSCSYFLVCTISIRYAHICCALIRCAHSLYCLACSLRSLCDHSLRSVSCSSLVNSLYLYRCAALRSLVCPSLVNSLYLSCLFARWFAALMDTSAHAQSRMCGSWIELKLNHVCGIVLWASLKKYPAVACFDEKYPAVADISFKTNPRNPP
jgi:hypothetical protein